MHEQYELDQLVEVDKQDQEVLVKQQADHIKALEDRLS